MEQFTKSEKDFFHTAPFFRGISSDVVHALFDIGDAVHFPKGAHVSSLGDTVDPVFFVMSGLLRVSACAESGRRITFLLVKRAEPYNLLGPYLDCGRFLEAEAARPTRCLRIKGKVFMAFTADHPVFVPNILRWIGIGLDSANSRILDLMEKKVENRVLRVLSTLYEKFGTPLLFTSQEVSEIAGTTPESTLRTMGQLRDMGIITTQRGQIRIHDPAALKNIEFGSLKI
ncbi:MAG: Crp/Fnr family transcriptional regulator [Desulfotignum sp.]|nr:Crp/Fnr family transcriptional regulator [Desulfotignum sp.]